ncbi:MAG TPA: hypothetical protein VK348_07505 [Planctomycetota bacterium]|nr:hypothetical protein [Planctomycetota bacterium]
MSLPAQAVRGGDLVTADFSTHAIYRVDGTGAISTLYSGPLLTGPSGLTVARSRDVIVADFNSSSLVRIDATTGVAGSFASGLGGPLRITQNFAGDFVVTSNSQHALLAVTPGGQVSTVASGAPFNRPFGVSMDWNGDYLVADDLAPGVFRVSPTGSITTIHAGLPLRLPQGVALFPNGDYAVIDGITDLVYRIDRGTGVVTIFCPNATLGGNPEGLVPDFGGGFVVSQSQASGSRIVAVDPLGGAVQIAAGAPMVNLEDVAKVPHLRGPEVLSTGPGASFTFDLDLPQNQGQLYALVLSASVFPGWQFPTGDPRSLTVNADAFFFATIGRNAPPFLGNWTAFLDGSGHGTATSDLSVLPTGALAGLLFFQQGFTLTSGLQVGGVCNVLRLPVQ